MIARAGILADGENITAEDIVFDVPTAPAGSLGRTVRAHEAATIQSTLTACDGRRRVAAERLSISERTLRYKLAAMHGAPAARTLQ